MPTSVPALGDERDDGGLAVVPTKGSAKHDIQHGIEEGRAGGCDLETPGTGSVPLEDVFFLIFDVAHNQSRPLSRGKLVSGDRLKFALSVLFEIGGGHWAGGGSCECECARDGALKQFFP